MRGGVVGAGQDQQNGPSALDKQREAGDLRLVQHAGAAEEEAVAGHGVTGAGAGQDQSVDAAEGGDHDGGRHEAHAESGEDGLEGGGGDAVRRGVLDGGEGQGDEVAEIGREVQRRDEERAEGQRERDVALGRADFAGGEGDVVPGVGRKQRTDLGDAQGDEESEGGGGAEAGGDGRDAAGRPEIAEVGMHGGGVPTQEERDDDEAEQRGDFAGREDVLNDAAVFEAVAVGPGEKDDDGDAEELGGGERESVGAADVDRRDEVTRLADAGEEDAGEAGEGDGDGGDGAGLDDEQQGPSIEEAAQGREGLAQVDVLAAGAGHHAGEFAVGERAATW